MVVKEEEKIDHSILHWKSPKKVWNTILLILIINYNAQRNGDFI